MKKEIRYFIIQAIFNLKNAYALRKSFWISVFSMVLNDCTFFVIWYLFMQATGPINGWSTVDVFGMLGVSLFIFGITNSFFYGIRDLPETVLMGSFDNVLLSPVDPFLKLAGNSFSMTAYGDLLQGLIVTIFYGVYLKFSFLVWVLYGLAIFLGCIIFISIRLLCSLVAFFIHDGEVVSTQLFEVYLRPGLYPGSIFPSKMKIFFMTIIPTLITSAVPIDIIKLKSINLFVFSFFVTFFWVCVTCLVFKIAIKRYESGNFLR